VPWCFKKAVGQRPKHSPGNGEKICFYGAGFISKVLAETYDLSKLNILGFFDKNYEKTGLKLDKYKIFLPSSIKDLKPEILIITIEQAGKVLPYIQELRQQYSLNFEIYDLYFNKI
jgi:FlaA1/EpsC-like NDP-sugar epimerase